MKLATYYKTEKNTFCRLVNLDETELTGYEKIYIFSESKQHTDIPEAFRRANNVIFGGTAFTNGTYVPFENSFIDYTLPKPSIYANFLKEKMNAGVPELEIERLLDSTYYRWHAGEEELPLPATRRRKRFYIYDIDFFQPGWRNILEKILEREPSSINLIHPAHYTKISDFLEVRENTLIARGNDAFLDLDIPLKETPVLMKRYKQRLLATILQTSHVYLSLGGSFYYKSQYLKDMIYKLNLLYVFWSNDIPMKIKYEEPKIGCIDPLADLSNLIATWSQRETKNTKSIEERLPKERGRVKISSAREQLEMVLERYPSAKTLFRQTLETVKKGGTWHHGY